ncbi:hypothetical protein I8J29_13000 [Paenibacillus sp. MWE-103]|uniref:Uncharacterized protein n=1 Tax=Paenibacillus artemisiicola TaxID=1172618 RepID=A0ABS3WAH6_9BACL|nr:hypothetical protein [Paenibacillus artemisiicola]MBO7745120.1 hypothetical protein [Paenibacillus artemisiicola]
MVLFDFRPEQLFHVFLLFFRSSSKRLTPQKKTPLGILGIAVFGWNEIEKPYPASLR